MRIPLIGTKEANTPENRVYPALDGAAKIVFDEADGAPSVHKVHAIKCMDSLPSGKSEFPFWLDGVYDNWEVYVTDKRIAVRNTFTMALLRKPKEKAGKVSAGHMPYKSITNLAAIFSNKNAPVLICASRRQDGTTSSFAIEGTDVDSIKKLAVDLYNHIDNYITAHKRKIIVDDNTEAEMKEAIADWSSFLEKAWTMKDVTVLVPCKEWDIIPNANNF